MVDVAKMFETLNTAVMASDTNFKIIYANDKCREMFKRSSNIESLVGRARCPPPAHRFPRLQQSVPT